MNRFQVVHSLPATLQSYDPLVYPVAAPLAAYLNGRDRRLCRCSRSRSQQASGPHLIFRMARICKLTRPPSCGLFKRQGERLVVLAIAAKMHHDLLGTSVNPSALTHLAKIRSKVKFGTLSANPCSISLRFCSELSHHDCKSVRVIGSELLDLLQPAAFSCLPEKGLDGRSVLANSNLYSKQDDPPTPAHTELPRPHHRSGPHVRPLCGFKLGRRHALAADLTLLHTVGAGALGHGINGIFLERESLEVRLIIPILQQQGGT